MKIVNIQFVKLASLCGLLIGIFMLFYFGLVNSNQQSTTPLLNKPVPHFNLQSLLNNNGLDETILLGEHYKILNVWASWCAACKVEHPFLLELSTAGIDIIGLNYRDNRADAIKVIESEGNPYREIIFDPNGLLALDLGVLGAPETFLIDPQGKIQARFSGTIDSTIWQQQFYPYLIK
ncbi:DsbE family thiol:disulfide interchange protein [Vibrio sp. TH_r3]|uniref:DsbE family thiol:disulfide interchange protein n=1 Tax=Vibrio sp. TH_r3 TaxID=3082084 RepID=UPI0029554BD2|nr:DsbE family thiol:disulfide interchange protein [Vibrio sp. TH_r3]MDV7102851.1 DsbE family thiol:disulfide interchange protein [Vibrio sp. TH_r3]